MRNVYQEQQCKFEVPANLFYVSHGYKERDSVQVRLNDDGTVYISESRDSRYPQRTVSAAVPFKLFVEELPRFIEYLESLAANEKGEFDDA